MENSQTDRMSVHARYRTTSDHLFHFPSRTWPGKDLKQAPRWCSVDLRDGNQSLPTPLTLAQKIEYFYLLLKLGFKEIEIGFPAASTVEYDFVRYLIVNNLIPEDVTISVLTQAKREQIDKTFNAVAGAKKVFIHVYNSTSVDQREIVFKTSVEGVNTIAVEAVTYIKLMAKNFPNTLGLEYSPESFTNTEPTVALNICNNVINVWQPDVSRPLIINLPATVETYTPNRYADVVEYFDQNLVDRQNITLSLHPHNDRGSAVAAAELGLLAGADRVEGCLLGHGERSGNVCLVTLAANFLTAGIDPQLDLSDLKTVSETVQQLTDLPVNPRHPYVGDLVHTAFSGSHQDAIKKGLAHTTSLEKSPGGMVPWRVPYLPVDPADIGFSYSEVIRVNSQSGKSGAAFVLAQNYGFTLPALLQVSFARVVQNYCEATGLEASPELIFDLFKKTYMTPSSNLILKSYNLTTEQDTFLNATLSLNKQVSTVSATGTGPLDAFVKILNNFFPATVEEFFEHALTHSSASKAVAYVLVRSGSRTHWAVGVDTSIVSASFSAVLTALDSIVDDM